LALPSVKKNQNPNSNPNWRMTQTQKERNSKIRTMGTKNALVSTPGLYP